MFPCENAGDNVVEYVPVGHVIKDVEDIVVEYVPVSSIHGKMFVSHSTPTLYLLFRVRDSSFGDRFVEGIYLHSALTGPVIHIFDMDRK